MKGAVIKMLSVFISYDLFFTGWGQRDFHKQPDNPCSETDKRRNTYSLDDDKLHEVEVSIIE